jgi:peptidoglycan/xylan/chitin deacetylase (PgdA/CDA1 family)
LAARIASKRLAVLAWHGLSDASAFRDQLEFLADRVEIVALEDVIAAARDERGLPERAALITFDDADRSHLEIALPLLKERAIPAIAFVVTGMLGTQEPYWWDEAEQLVRLGGVTPGISGDGRPVVAALKRAGDEQRLAALDELRSTASAAAEPRAQLREEELRELDLGGVAIGNHSVTHPCLNRCPEDKIRNEIEGAHETLTAILGHPPAAFAYPNGDWSPAAEQIAKGAGYQLGFLFDHRLQRWPPRDPLRMSRLRVGSSTSLDRFAITLSGLHPLLHRLVGRS